MDQLRTLFNRYLQNQCTTEEIQVLMRYFSSAEQGPELKQAIREALAKSPAVEETDEDRLEERIKRVQIYLNSSFSKPSRKLSPAFFKYAAAAALLITLSVGYLFFSPSNKGNSEHLAAEKQDVQPGSNKAVLTLSDGSQVSLTDADPGVLAKQAGVSITKTKDGQLIYTAQTPHEGDKVLTSVINRISTPRGGQYQVNLPDGTKVWLNAASSLKFPASFVNAAKRRVELNGEAYFEVAKDKTKPFIVSTGPSGSGQGQETEVLGTHFNLNNYPEQGRTVTTLMEGSVKITGIRTGTSGILKPGQQSVLDCCLQIYHADIEAAMDWKNGNFYFNDENIKNIMLKLSRWYDIEVEYKGKVPEFGFGGEISRTKKLSEVLKVLETTGAVHFIIEGRRVIVMN
ncbi:FecR family protein [Pedobacter nutrimenti]|uniref:FecR family protein n=1 Tax=Pedobacter nutrimenti TaxID=1241337 RepID=UPI00292FF7CC|nr:FecR family protein [Pedobacter nutrimenti]